MSQKPLLKLFGIVFVGLLLALIFLPVVAGLVEGNFGYLGWEFKRGWNNDHSLLQSTHNIYAWSFWRISMCEKPDAYLFYELIQTIKMMRV